MQTAVLPLCERQLSILWPGPVFVFVILFSGKKVNKKAKNLSAKITKPGIVNERRMNVLTAIGEIKPV